MKKLCAVDGCDREHWSSGYCSAHYQRVRKTGDTGGPLPPKQPRRWRTGLCEVEGCGRPNNASRGMCSMHYLRTLRTGDPGSAGRLKGAPGTGTLLQGYRYIFVDGRQVAQHRVIMEQHLGRPLADHENVHHINGVRDDNRVENLELWSKKQPPGQRVADKIAWAVAFLTEYGYSVEAPGGE